MFSFARLMFDSHVEHTLFVLINIVQTSIFIYLIIIYRTLLVSSQKISYPRLLHTFARLFPDITFDKDC